MRYLVVLICAATLVTRPALAVPAALIPPVDGAVVRTFDPPAGRFGPGHRGIDLAVTAGARVRAAGPGTVSFAGLVAGELVLTIDHGSAVETTYSRLGEVWVQQGDRVAAGTWVGLAGDAHTGVAGIHFAVKVNDVYTDPALWLAPTDLGGALRLTPLLWEPSDDVPEPLARALAPRGPGNGRRDCAEPTTRQTITLPPNDNVAVAVAGIASKTAGPDAADMYHPGPAFFGYPEERIYRFSYRGVDGPRLHEDYDSADTYGDIEVAARRLADLVRAIGERHPGADVDLIGHSQGGIVARAYLAARAAGRLPGGPRIEHLVTLASPHSGAPAAANVGFLRDKTVIGPPLLALAGAASAQGLPIPDPNSQAVVGLTPGSDLMTSLASQDVTFGTRVLALGIPNDAVVPADRTRVPGGSARIVPPRGAIQVMGGRAVPGNGHSAIVTSPTTRALVHDFLRGQALACPTAWDDVGSRFGRALSWGEGRIPAAVAHSEGGGGRVLRTLGDLFLTGDGER